MSLSARDKVLKIRQAEFQVQRLRDELQRAFPSDEFKSPLLNNQFSLNKKRYMKEIPFKNPRQEFPTLEMDDLFTFKQNHPVMSMSDKALIATQIIKDGKHLHQIPSNYFVTQSPFYNSPYTESNSMLPAMERAQFGKDIVPKSLSPSAVKTNKKTNKNATQLPQQLKQQIALTKNSVEMIKIKGVAHLTKRTKTPFVSLKSQGRMFRHRFNFQESMEPSPLVSRTPSTFTLSSTLNVSLKQASGSGNNQLKLKSSSIENKTPIKASITSTTLGSIRPSTNNLCLPSLLNKCSSSWIDRRFPQIANEVKNWQDDQREWMTLDHLRYSSRKLKRIVNRPSSSPERFKDQPLPHQRGLIGIEISEFDPHCAIFYRDRKGTYNPHLRGPRDHNNNISKTITDEDYY